VHRPVGEQLEDRGTHVAAPAASAAAGPATAASARSTGSAGSAGTEATGAEAEAATWAEAAWAEDGSETEAGVAACAVFTDVVTEVATGLSALLVQGTALAGTESETWTAHVGTLEMTLLGSFIEWGVHVCVLAFDGKRRNALPIR
jgi:hypothetical protein